jgi:hypothetical protein
MPPRPFRKGISGESLESALQRLLADNPDVLPVDEMVGEDVEPPVLCLLAREVRIGGMSLDLLFVDQEGILTLVEGKLVGNPEARRSVIGQLLEYAAHASAAWQGGRLRQIASSYWADKGRRADDVLRERYGPDVDVEALWLLVEENLRVRRIRLVIAADELRPTCVA